MSRMVPALREPYRSSTQMKRHPYRGGRELHQQNDLDGEEVYRRCPLLLQLLDHV
jgi:hypothetical protein